jgi:hypothetical protein
MKRRQADNKHLGIEVDETANDASLSIRNISLI